MSETRKDDAPGNGEISAAYRARSAEMPPAELDARILAAAHRAVGSRPGGARHRWFRWIDAPFATAAVVLVSATLILLMREEGMLGRRAATEAKRAEETAVQAPAAKAIENGAADVSAPAAPTQARARAEEEADAVAPQGEPPAAASEAPAAANATISPEAGTAAPAPPAEPLQRDALAPPAPAAERSGAPSGVSTEGAGPTAPVEGRETAPEPFPAEAPAADATLRQQAAPPAGTSERAAAMPSTPDSESRPAPAAAPPPAVAPGPAELRAPAAEAEAAAGASRLAKEKAAGPVAQTPEERWLQEIRELLRAGRFTDAQLSLARFVKAYPGYQVPADILDALKPAD